MKSSSTSINPSYNPTFTWLKIFLLTGIFLFFISCQKEEEMMDPTPMDIVHPESDETQLFPLGIQLENPIRWKKCLKHMII